MTLVHVATRNHHKVAELRSLLRGLEIELRPLPDAAPEVIEDGDTFAANAILKADSAARFTGAWALADDSGLAVDALGGAPGVYSARFAGVAGDGADAANIALLLARLADVPEQHRGAAFHSVIALARPGQPTLTFAGEVRGRILREPRGSNGFGYDPLFFYPAFTATFAEVAAERKNEVSHRARAVAAFLDRAAATPRSLGIARGCLP